MDYEEIIRETMTAMATNRVVVTRFPAMETLVAEAREKKLSADRTRFLVFVRCGIVLEEDVQ